MSTSIADAPQLDQWYGDYNAAVKADYLKTVELRKAQENGQSPFMGETVCQACHQEIHSTWSGSQHAIAYEDLVRDTETVMRAVARFTGLPFTRAMLKPTVLGEVTVVRTASQKTEGVFQSEASWSDGLTSRERTVVALTHAVFNLLPGLRVDRRRLEKTVEASRTTPQKDS